MKAQFLAGLNHETRAWRWSRLWFRSGFWRRAPASQVWQVARSLLPEREVL